MFSKTVKTKAIILKRKDFGEAGKLVTVFTQNFGKLSFIAPGVRRIFSRRAAHLEPLNYVDLVFSPSENTGSIGEISTIDSFESLKRDLHKATLGFYLAEVIDRLLPEKDVNPKVFSFLLTCLMQLSVDDQDQIAGQNKVKEYVSAILWELGYLPHNHYPKDGLTAFVEQIAERRIKSRVVIEEVANLEP